jgi:2-dehydro-3-deoxyphosphogluconate aldolase/(4S)-4-hydroxy-2-oxoglutarate aldolase
MSDATYSIEQIVDIAPVIPVLVLEDADTALMVGEALFEGGLPVLEITLRTPAALECIRVLSRLKGAVVGAGTVLSPDQLSASLDAGASFAVSPGSTPRLVEAALKARVPYLPGVANASEAMMLAEQGLSHLKFFPAEALGGTKHLASLASPLPHIRFCPTGGITQENAKSWLSLPNVCCVGGSWVAPADAIRQRDAKRITSLAREAASLRKILR